MNKYINYCIAIYKSDIFSKQLSQNTKLLYIAEIFGYLRH